MDLSQTILSEITVFNKYAKFIPEISRRETWQELCERNMAMHINKYPQLRSEIQQVYKDYVITKKVLPSMRSLQFGGAPIELSNSRMFNCFSVDTRFITSEGTKSFEDFSDGDSVKVLTHLGNWKHAVVKNYGKQSLNKVTFTRGRSTKTVKVTKDHRWILKDGSETTALKVGDSILPIRGSSNFDYSSSNPFERLYWCYGYIFGDGTKVMDKDGTHKYSMVRLCGDESTNYLPRFEEMGFKSSKPLSCKGDSIVYTGTYLKTKPDLTKDSLNLICAFMDGYLSADASKNSNWHVDNKRSKYDTITSHDSYHVSFLRDALELCGYFINREEDLSGEETNFGIRPSGATRFNITNHIGSANHLRWGVHNIEDSVSTEDVWCLEVEDDHSFVLSGGLVTGNCAFVAVDHPDVFSETMFLLLGGSGVGYGVQRFQVEQLPAVARPKDRQRRFLIGDSIEGWADAVKILVEAYFYGKSDPVFDYRDIRPKGSRLITSGGKAPGPAPLKLCIENLRAILDSAVGRKLAPIEVHDMQCHIADAVLSGGIRRAAMIALFSKDDMDMLTCKGQTMMDNWEFEEREENDQITYHGYVIYKGKRHNRVIPEWDYNTLVATQCLPWYYMEQQRGRANNSVVLERGVVTEDEFKSIWKRVQDSGSGEPGVFWTNDLSIGSNPCCEISLNSMQFCNLSEINSSDITTQEELNARAKAAAFLGTLQAGYTDFHYLRPEWKEMTEKEALIGVGITGIGSGSILPLDLKQAAEVVKTENARVAVIIEVNVAARSTTIKPSGTTSCVVGSASGIHAWHNTYYIRRMRVGKNEALYKYMVENFPSLIEDCYHKPHLEAVMSFPQKAPEGSILRTESFMDLLERVKKFTLEWVRNGHREGSNFHNVSCTISLKDDEWDACGNWMWANRDFYTGISVLPYNGGTYVQAPFEDITKEQYDSMMAVLSGSIDLSKVLELDDNTALKESVACSGGACEIV